MKVDILCALSYGLTVAFVCGPVRSLLIFTPALIFFALSFAAKTKGLVMAYVWTHGIWHILAAIGLAADQFW